MPTPTIAQIEAQIITAKNAEPLLTPLNSPSNLAIWRLWVYITAVAHQLVFAAFESLKQEVSISAKNQIIGTAQWYAAIVLDFEDSNGLNPVSRVSVRESGTKVIIKVAKLNGGLLLNLDMQEMQDLRGFIKAKKVVGTDIDVWSQTADLIALRLSIRYIGTASVVASNVKSAIKAYLAALPFDENLSKGLLVDYLIGNVPGVADAYVDELSIDIGFGYEIIQANFAISDAGFFEVGTINGYDAINLNMYQ